MKAGWEYTASWGCCRSGPCVSSWGCRALAWVPGRLKASRGMRGVDGASGLYTGSSTHGAGAEEWRSGRSLQDYFLQALPRENTSLVFRDLIIPRKNNVSLYTISICRAKPYMGLYKLSFEPQFRALHSPERKIIL